MEAVVHEQALDERLAALEAARAWSPRVISKLESHIRSADDAALFRINPIRFATEKNIAEAEAVDLFLHGAFLGLFEMDWLLLCSACSCVVESFHSLKGVRSQFHCGMCRADLEAALDDYIAVTFTVSPQIRSIAFHKPEDLPARDFAFAYKLTDEGLLPDGTPFVKALQGWTSAISYLPPGTTRLELAVQEGLLHAWSPDSDAGFDFRVGGAPAISSQTVHIHFLGNRCEPSEGTVAPGRLAFEIENATGQQGFIAISAIPAEALPILEIPRLEFVTHLSGSRLLATQTFRDLFRSEAIRAVEGIGVRDITLLFTDLKGSTDLYNRIGDLNALSLVQQHFELLREVTVQHGGAIIKTIGDAVMAAFTEPTDAVRASLAMLQNMEVFNRRTPNREVILKIGLHRGAAIAVTLNERLDYFGQTVNIAARVQSLSDANEICLTSEVLNAPGVKDILASYAMEQERVQLKGIHQQIPVFRIHFADIPAL
ncbi:adenylate/guanylate cyclase domain-containing protein [Microvirga splendida]|uniref:Adenylate/guanylate cyclase domain-containing protein n=1 Tax=Microvirga splendida TaxID=2795727 RepID=A0ABS0Y9G7_9HYPH|nr:adenylate/guanylate cyclase domain-containing protein [Microvirga splendida]MBJ6128568.1 adenylate/guanylate cyclase domain-containing protein [Microvirga splendida]